MTADWFPVADSLIRQTAMVWFIISMFLWLLVGLFINWFFRRSGIKSEGSIVFTQRVERKSTWQGCYSGSGKEETMFESDYEYAEGMILLLRREKDRRNWGGASPIIESPWTSEIHSCCL